MSKKEVLKKLVKNGFGLPRSIEIYNYLSCSGEIEIDKNMLFIYMNNHGCFEDDNDVYDFYHN